MDITAILPTLGPLGAIILAVVYLQRQQQSSLAKLIKLAQPATLTLKIDEEQLEAFTNHRQEHHQQAARIEQLEWRLAQLSEVTAADAAE